MRDILKSFFMGLAAAAGFFLAISFTADAEDSAAEAEQREYQIYLAGLEDGAREASKNWRTCLFTEYRK